MQLSYETMFPVLALVTIVLKNVKKSNFADKKDRVHWKYLDDQCEPAAKSVLMQNTTEN